jgi:hypothetical protein
MKIGIPRFCSGEGGAREVLTGKVPKAEIGKGIVNSVFLGHGLVWHHDHADEAQHQHENTGNNSTTTRQNHNHSLANSVWEHCIIRPGVS